MKQDNTSYCNSTPMCLIKECECKKVKCEYLHKQYGMKKWVFNLIVIVISFGAIVPFLSEVLCTIWFPNVSLGLSTWNQFVSIILGIIATLLSIVSIIMGFKNYEDTLSVQEKYMEALKEISVMAVDLKNMRDDVKNMSSMKQQIPVDTPMQIPTQWDKEDESYKVN